MRRLMWFTVGFASMIAAAAYIKSDVWLAAALIACLCICLTLILIRRKTGISAIAMLFLFGVFAGRIWSWGYNAIILSLPQDMDGEECYAVIEISDYSYDTDFGIVSDGTIKLSGITYRVRVYLDSVDVLYPGDTVAGQMRFQYTMDNAYNDTTYHAEKGIFLLAYPDDTVIVSHTEKMPAKYFAIVLRRQITDYLDDAFADDTVAFARALLLGDSSLLDYEVDTAFKISGIRHVIAVSGLHISILFSLIYTVSGKRRLITAALGIPILLTFTAAAGFTPSIVRACIMQILMIMALLFNKEYDPPTALSFAVLIMLLANPITVRSAGFQLSVGCVIGIFLFSGKIHRILLNERRAEKAKGKSFRAKLIRFTVGSVSVSLSAMIVTTPLCAYYFGTVSIIGVVTNLLILWLISFVFYGIIAVCVVSAIYMPAGALIASVISWPIRFIIMTSVQLSKLPFAAVYTNNIYIILWLVFSYLTLILYLFSRIKKPALLAGCVIASLVLCITMSRLEPRFDNYRITVLDVGQGQSILIQSRGHSYLVDCGGDTPAIAADAASQLLLSQGINHLDGIFITHFDKDHAAGTHLLLSRIGADKLYLPDIEDDADVLDTLQLNHSLLIRSFKENTKLELDNIIISLFPAQQRDAGNESSMCILFQIDNYDILITGERGSAGEYALMEHVDLPQIDMLVVGHHGSKTSTSFELLQKTKPVTAVISLSGQNRYGHPAKEVLNRLKLFECQILRTDQEGTIVLRG